MYNVNVRLNNSMFVCVGTIFLWVLIPYLSFFHFFSIANATGEEGTEMSGAGVGAPGKSIFLGYRENVVDMDVKTIGSGGFVRVIRSWDGGTWHINRRWARLKLPVGCDSSSCSIERSSKRYEKSANGVFINIESSAEVIIRTATGFRWQDKKGNYIDYDGQGYMTNYGDRNRITASVQYELPKRISGVFDHFNKQILWYEYNQSNQISAVRDYSGRRVEYRYDNVQNLVMFVDVRGNTWTYTYERGTNVIQKNGLSTYGFTSNPFRNRIKTKVDAEGRTTTIGYTTKNDSDTLVSVSDALGEKVYYRSQYTVSHAYYKEEKTSLGKIIEEWFTDEGDLRRRDVNGDTVYSMEELGRMRIVADASGNETKKIYDEWGRLIKETYADATTALIQYDTKFSNVLKRVDEGGVITHYTYDDGGNLLQTTEAVALPEQRVTTYAYDEYGNRLSRMQVGDSDTVGVNVSYTYDKFGNVLTRTDGEGHVSQYTYDVMGNVLAHIDARGKLWKFAYDAAGNRLSSKDPLGNRITYTYDKIGNFVEVVDAKLRTTTRSYDLNNRVNMIEDASGQRSLYIYDADGKLLNEFDSVNKTKKLAYDLPGRLIRFTDGNDNVVSIEYVGSGVNGGGNIASINHVAFTRSFKYDKRGRKIEQRDLLSEDETILVREYAYDNVGNLLSQRKYVIKFNYDFAGNQVIDDISEGKVFHYNYDSLGRTISVIDAAGNVINFRYDSRDNLIELQNSESNVYGFTYDRRGDLVKETQPLGGEVRYSYDGLGNLLSSIDAVGIKRTYSYDDVGHVTAYHLFASEDDTVSQKNVSYDYDEAGNLLSYNDGVSSARYGYDFLDRKVSAVINYGPFEKSYAFGYYANGKRKWFQGPDERIVNYTYDANNQIQTVKLPDGSAVSFNNYVVNRPGEISFPGGTTTTYGYDDLLQTQRLQAKDPAGSIFLAHAYRYDGEGKLIEKQTQHGQYQYTYDALDRLVHVDNPTLEDEGYSYDSVGNRLSDLRNSGTWEYNSNNQLTSIGSDISYEYNANGALIRKREGIVLTDFSYDFDGRLVEVKNGSAIIAKYYYDPFGRRLWKEVDGVKTYFLYSADGLVAEFNSIGDSIRQYGYIPDGLWSTDPVFMMHGEQYYFYHNDYLGTPQKLTSTTGEVVWSAKYQAFGYANIDAVAVDNSLRFAGQYLDKETGLHYNFHRYYDPNSGRYVSYDPIGLKGGINPYAYAGLAPTNMIDPQGLFITIIPGMVLGGVGGALCGGTAGDILAGAFGGAFPGIGGVVASAVAGAVKGFLTKCSFGDAAIGATAGSAAASAGSAGSASGGKGVGAGIGCVVGNAVSGVFQ